VRKRSAALAAEAPLQAPDYFHHARQRRPDPFRSTRSETRHRSSHGHQEPSLVDGQNTLDAMITGDPALLQNIHLLSEALFPNGLGYGAMLDRPAATMAPILGRLEPFVFLMMQTGTWLLDPPARADEVIE
jgi:hypothetical protein